MTDFGMRGRLYYSEPIRGPGGTTRAPRGSSRARPCGPAAPMAPWPSDPMAPWPRDPHGPAAPTNLDTSVL